MDPNTFQQKEEEARREIELENLKPIDFATLEKTIKKWMLVPDEGIIKFLCAFYVANFLDRRAVWAMVIAPSGGGKTELLNGLIDLENIYEISLLTTSTFLSGMPGEQNKSLLPQLNGKIMMFKDWTTILSLHRDTRTEIMSQLREIWDGRMKKTFGNGKTVEWRGKVGVLAACTQVVDLAQQQHAALGERFIFYRLIMPDRKEVAKKSLQNDASQEQMATEIRNAFYSFFKGLNFKPDNIPAIPEDVKEKLIALANLSTMARSAVIRESYHKKEVIFVPMAEMPTRILQQLNSLLTGCMIVNGGNYLAEDMKIAYKCALDSIPQTNKMVMIEMARRDNQSTSDIATALGYPTQPIRLYLENLAMLGVCKRMKASETEEGGTSDRWIMHHEFSEMLRHYDNIKVIQSPEEKELEEKLAEEARLAEEAKELERQEAMFGLAD